jgi:hypothetical protein
LTDSRPGRVSSLRVSGHARVVALNQIQSQRLDARAKAGLIVLHDEELDDGFAHIGQVENLRELKMDVVEMGFELGKTEMRQVADIEATDLVLGLDGVWGTAGRLSAVENRQRLDGKRDLVVCHFDALADGRICGPLRGSGSWRGQGGRGIGRNDVMDVFGSLEGRRRGARGV